MSLRNLLTRLFRRRSPSTAEQAIAEHERRRRLRQQNPISHACMSTHTYTEIPLKSLRLSPTNARQDPGDVRSLAHSIESIGLISALAVTKNGRGYLVEAGGRRLAALQLLRENKAIPADHPVPCLLFDTPDLARSLAENCERLDMDAVQQFQAFGRLLKEGRTIEEIADKFSVTAQFVRQRIKLCELIPEAIDAYRAGRLTFEHLHALTYGTPDQQRRYLSAQSIPDACEIRRQLRGDIVDSGDKRAICVGLDTYTAAGGRTIEDLFSDRVQLLDIDLLDQLTADRLQAAVDQALADGAAWAEVVDSYYSPDVHKRFERAYAHFRPTPEQSAELASIKQRIQQIEDSGDDSDDMDSTLETLADREEAIREAAMVLADNRPTGKLICLESNGEIQSIDHIRKSDAKQLANTEGDPDAGESPPAKPLTKNNTLQIAQVREAALAEYLQDTPHMAVALLAMALDHSTGQVIGNSRTPLLFHLRTSTSSRPDDMQGPLVDAIETRQAARRQGITRTMPDLAWYAALTIEALHQIIADAMALALIDPQACESTGQYNAVPAEALETIQHLMTASEIDLAQYWKPDPAWLKSYGKANILTALESINHPAEGLDKLKLGELASQASEVLAEAGWLPEEFLAAEDWRQGQIPIARRAIAP